MVAAPAVLPASRFRRTAPARRSLEHERRAAQLRTIECGIALVVLFALGVRYLLPRGASSGLALGLVVAPMWLSALKTFRWARLSVGLGLVTLVCGLVLTASAAGDHAISVHNAFGSSFLLLEIVVGLGVVLWVRTLMPPWVVGGAYGAGLLVHAALYPGELGATNPLKFTWLMPAAVLLLGLAWSRPRWVQTVLVGALAAVAGIADARAVFGTAFIAFVLLAWQQRPAGVGRRSSWAWTAAMLAALGYAIYSLASTLLISGYLGSAAQERSAAQVERSGSLLLGGRPEIAATYSLLTHYPGGFGPGVIATSEEVITAKEGMLSINYDPNNGYVDRYMFGSSVELHSTIGDLWAAFGLAGLGLAVLVLVAVVIGVSRMVAARTGTALVVFLAAWTLWNLAFSPLQSAAPTLLLAMALIIADHPRARAVPPKAPTTPTTTEGG